MPLNHRLGLTLYLTYEFLSQRITLRTGFAITNARRNVQTLASVNRYLRITRSLDNG